MKRIKIGGIIFLSAILAISTFFIESQNNITVASAMANKTVDKAEEVLGIDDSHYLYDDLHLSRDIMQDVLDFAGHQESDNGLQLSNDITLTANSTKEDILSSIVSDETFSISGTITDNVKVVPIVDYYDFSAASKYQIAEWAYEANLITEQEKIECYCDLIIQRNFNNTTCLESVLDEIQSYSQYASERISNKITAVLTPPFENNSSNANENTRAISNESTYSSTNFKIYYDSTHTTSAIAQSVADYFEEVRAQYVAWGFKTPILKLFNSKYQVYLDPAPASNGALATTTKAFTLTNTCASHITLWNFTVLDAAMEENIAHEYFHAIQNAYNHQSNWFKEACANWSTIAICDTYNNTQAWLRSFINSNTDDSMPAIDGYASVLLPLTIQRNFGGVSAIRSIYEEYTEYGVNGDLDTLRTIITNGIVNNGYSDGSFNSAYRSMASFLVYSSLWFRDIADTSTWPNVRMTNTWSLSTSLQSYSNTLNYMSSRYYRLNVPTGYTGNIQVAFDFTNGSGAVQLYTVDGHGSHIVTYYRTTADGICEFEIPDMGEDVQEAYLIVCNTSSSESITFDADVSLYNYGDSITFSSYTRYIERLCYLERGEYKDYTITFSNAGYKTIQTFGGIDVKLELYSASGTLLASDDDDGYSLNSLLRFYASANTQYKIRVKYYSSTVSGITRLAITPAQGPLNTGLTTLEKYEDIFRIYDWENYTWYSYAQQNYTRFVTFVPPTSGNYTVELESVFDNYVYLIDPRSNALLVYDVDYNDDGGEGLNAKLSMYLNADNPYLIIYSAYNPSAAFDNYDEGDDLAVKISKN